MEERLNIGFNLETVSFIKKLDIKLDMFENVYHQYSLHHFHNTLLNKILV